MNTVVATAETSPSRAAHADGLARRLKSLLEAAKLALRSVPSGDIKDQGIGGGRAQLAAWSRIVEASPCSALLRARLFQKRSRRKQTGALGPILDVGSGPMVTSWLLATALRPVVVVPGRNQNCATPLLGAPGLVCLSTESLSHVIEAFHILDVEPDLLFVQPSLVLDQGNTRDQGRIQDDWAALSRVRRLHPNMPVVGAMLNSEGGEVPHWVIPSLFAPVLASENDMTVELPCWATGCSSSPTPSRELLTLVMIVKNEARRIQETIASVAGAATRMVLLDTGSEDGTQRLSRKACKKHGLKLELYEEPFVDFATTRNRALKLASNVTEFVLMLSGDETVMHADQLKQFLEQHAGYCGSTEDFFNLRVVMGPNTWYWSERLMKSDNHAGSGWPDTANDTWRYVGVTHEAYVNPVRTMRGDIFIQYVGDTDVSRSTGMPRAVAGEFYVRHDAVKTEEAQRKRWWQDVRLLEGYLDRQDAEEDLWQYARALFYLAQSLRSLGFGEGAAELWRRYLALDLSKWRQFSYLRYGAHSALGQLCAERHIHGGATGRKDGMITPLPQDCREHFEQAHVLCPRAEPLVQLAMALPAGSADRRSALRRAQQVAHLESSTGHCAIFAEPGLYRQLPQLLAEAESQVDAV